MVVADTLFLRRNMYSNGIFYGRYCLCIIQWHAFFSVLVHGLKTRDVVRPPTVYYFFFLGKGFIFGIMRI